MRILRMPSYYEPEQVSSTHLSRDVEDAFVEAGFEMEIYAPAPTRGVTAQVREEYRRRKYEEEAGGAIRIHRFSMFREGRAPVQRALRYLLCNAVQYLKGINAKGIDLILSGSTPPTQGVLCALVKKRLSGKQGKYVPFVYHLQDIFPDSLATTGLAKKGSLLYRIGSKIESYTYRNADVIVTISEDMKRNIMGKGVPEEKVEVIPNWIDTERITPINDDGNRLFDEYRISRDKFRVVYAGNLGYAQGIDTVLRAARLLADQDGVEFLIFGSGAAEQQLREEAKDIGNVRFLPFLPLERAPEVYSLGNACLVCCKKGTGGIGVPSKTWTIMACGRPLLVSFDMESELSRVVSSTGTGLCSEAGNAEALAANVRALLRNGELCASMGAKARSYVVQNMDKRVAVRRFVRVIDHQLAKSTGRTL